ncbi:MAG: hypothetical protein EOS50_04275 [Mesorhizobium sp.]|nr:MAG: hypothetical protein EOS50_04275 [Mesorhizobium sp.]
MKVGLQSNLHALSTGVEDAKAILVPPDLDQRFGYGDRNGGFGNLSSIAGIGVRSHRCEQLLSGLGNGSRLLQELGALGGKT